MDLKDVEDTADRMYTMHKTFDRAIDAAICNKHLHDLGSPGYVFWYAVIDKLRRARKSLGV